MRNKFIWLLYSLLLVIWLNAPANAQNQGKMSKAEKKSERAEKSYDRAYARARRLTLKHRREIQTKETRKQMKEAHRRAIENNNVNDPSFLERLFIRKKPKKH